MEHGIFELIAGFANSDWMKNESIDKRLQKMKMPIEGVARDVVLSEFVSSGSWVQKEVQTEIGRIDLLTDEYIFEFKQVKKWKEGLGQLLVYSHYYPDRHKVLCLVGMATESYLQIVRDHCTRFEAVVLLKEVDTDKLRSLLQDQAKRNLRKQMDRASTHQQELNIEG